MRRFGVQFEPTLLGTKRGQIYTTYESC